MSVSYFMAANSGKGFFSLFDEIYYPREGWKLFIIKGGPGTGKSSVMKQIAQTASTGLQLISQHFAAAVYIFRSTHSFPKKISATCSATAKQQYSFMTSATKKCSVSMQMNLKA